MPTADMALVRLAADGADLLFTCLDCGAIVVAPIDKVMQRFGEQATVGDVQAPVVCRHCNSIDVRVQPLARRAVA